MKTFPTFRRGRQYYVPGPRTPVDQQGQQYKTFIGRAGGWCALLITTIFVLLPLFLYIHIENDRFLTYTSLLEVSRTKIVELPDRDNESVKLGDVVHGTSKQIESTVTDPGLGITIEDALTLNRNTEYCQWSEIRSESCRTCSRKVRNDDGTIETENYPCDCVIQYDYVKGWQSYLINSFLFDQPGAHYNPQRDPLPSAYFVSKDAQVTFSNVSTSKTTTARLSPDLLISRIRGATTRPVNWVYNGVPRPAPFWSRWIPDRSRYEDLSSLEYLVRFAPSLDTRFTYVGDGYFFSAHEASRMERLMKIFGEYLEGSLFDWQIGDIFPSCTAGDIRIKYSVQDPQTVSVLGQVGSITSSTEIKLQSIASSNDFKVGFLHEGVLTATEMIESEDASSRSFTLLFRVLGFIWAFFTCRNLCFIAGYDFGKANFSKQLLVTLSLWFFVLTLTWIRIWGYLFYEAKGLIAVTIILVTMTFRDPLPKVGGKWIVEDNNSFGAWAYKD